MVAAAHAPAESSGPAVGCILPPLRSKMAPGRRWRGLFLPLRVPVKHQRDGRRYSSVCLQRHENPSGSRSVQRPYASRRSENLRGSPERNSWLAVGRRLPSALPRRGGFLWTRPPCRGPSAADRATDRPESVMVRLDDGGALAVPALARSPSTLASGLEDSWVGKILIAIVRSSRVSRAR